MQHRKEHLLDCAFSHAGPVTPIEPLEARTLLAAAELPAVDGILRITGTRKADTIFVTYGPNALDTLYVRINKAEFSFPFADVFGIRIQAGANNDHIEFRGFATNPDRFKIPATIYGSTGDDLIIGPASPSRIYGGTGDDKIFAGFSRDTVYGEEGNDTIHGGPGNDFLSGGDGDDHITGGLGIDSLFGDAGNDTLISRGDLPHLHDTRPFLPQRSFDLVDGGGGHDRADPDPEDRLISIERIFRAF